MENVMTQLFTHTVSVSKASGALLHFLGHSEMEIAVDECYSEIAQYRDAVNIIGSAKVDSEAGVLPLFVEELENSILILHEYFATYSFMSDPDDDDAEFYPSSQVDTIAELADNIEYFRGKDAGYSEEDLIAAVRVMSESSSILSARVDSPSGSECFNNAVLSVSSAWKFIESLTEEEKQSIDTEALENDSKVVAREAFNYAQEHPLSESEVDLLKNFGKSFKMNVLELTENSWMYCA